MEKQLTEQEIEAHLNKAADIIFDVFCNTAKKLNITTNQLCKEFLDGMKEEEPIKN